MFQKIKRLGAYLIIIILLPYVITVFLNGSAIPVSVETDTQKVRVLKNDREVDVQMEEYGIGKMAMEIPLSYEMEALKVQAILVRTTLYSQLQEKGSEGVLAEEYWTRAEMRKQWGSETYKKNYAKLKAAWEDTEGQVILYGDDLAYVPYCRLTNGNTRDGSEVLGTEAYPYLKIRECPLDVEAEEQIQTTVLDEMDVSITQTDTAGYVTGVQVGQETMSGEEFREKYNLPSASLVIKSYEGKIRITTRGVGHGLGLSQYTANKMAENGKKAEEILAYFFVGTEIKEVAEIVSGVE